MGKKVKYVDTLKQYMKEIDRYHLLSREEELELFNKYAKTHDKNIKNNIILANSKLVVSIASEIKKTVMPNIDLLDLINEGNLGLIKSIYKFDPNKGTIFATYATYWIQCYIQRYIYQNSTAFKTSVNFSRNARIFYHKLNDLQSKTDRTYSPKELAEIFGIDEETVMLYFQFSTNHISLDERVGEEQESSISDFVIDENSINPEEYVINNESINNLNNLINSLSEKEQNIIKLRFGFINDTPHTLEEIGQIYGVTRERIRQIESETLNKLLIKSKK